LDFLRTTPATTPQPRRVSIAVPMVSPMKMWPLDIATPLSPSDMADVGKIVYRPLFDNVDR
jgi:hypothetical protein